MSKIIKAKINIGKREFPIQLCQRVLDLGRAGKVPYYWMDARQFRTKPPGSNFRSCVDHFLPALVSQGMIAREDITTSYLAELFAWTSRSKSVQKVYLHAHLDERAGFYAPESEKRRKDAEKNKLLEKISKYELPERVCKKLHKLAFSRDTFVIQHYLEKVLQLKPPTEKNRDAYEKQLADISKSAHDAYIRRAQSGLTELASTDYKQFSSVRKRGGDPTQLKFLNYLYYEAKLSFYLCYTNAWIGLIPWLKNNCALDSKSERLLRLWHCQNQPRENPGNAVGASRDVFCGQILALHPLSAFVFERATHRVALGNWLCQSNESFEKKDYSVQENEYWSVVETILIAATEYSKSRSLWDGQRDRKEIDLAHTDLARSELSVSTIQSALNDYAKWNKKVCPGCGGELKVLKVAPAPQDSVLVEFQCAVCERKYSCRVRRIDFAEYLK